MPPASITKARSPRAGTTRRAAGVVIGWIIVRAHHTLRAGLSIHAQTRSAWDVRALRGGFDHGRSKDRAEEGVGEGPHEAAKLARRSPRAASPRRHGPQRSMEQARVAARPSREKGRGGNGRGAVGPRRRGQEAREIPRLDALTLTRA